LAQGVCAGRRPRRAAELAELHAVLCEVTANSLP